MSFRNWFTKRIRPMSKVASFRTSPQFDEVFKTFDTDDELIRAYCWQCWRAGRKNMEQVLSNINVRDEFRLSNGYTQ